MERRQRPAGNGTWDGSRYGNDSRPQRFRHHEAPPYEESPAREYHPDGGPWESRPPYTSGSHGRSEHRDGRGDGYHEPQQQGGPQGLYQFRPPRREVFPHGGARPGLPPHVPGPAVSHPGGVSHPIVVSHPGGVSHPIAVSRPGGARPGLPPHVPGPAVSQPGVSHPGVSHPGGVSQPGVSHSGGVSHPSGVSHPGGVSHPIVVSHPGGVSRPGVPPVRRADEMYGNIINEGLRSPVLRNDCPIPSIPLHRAPEPPQGVPPFKGPQDGTRQTRPPGRPQQVIAASTQENIFEHRRENQDVTQRITHHKEVYRSGERYEHHGGPQRISDERRDPMYTESPLSMSEHPDLFLQGGPSKFGGPDVAPSRYSSSHLGRGPPASFQQDFPHDRSNLQLAYQNEGAQPASSLAGIYVNTPPVPDALHYRAPSPGIQQCSTQPAQNPPQQGRYQLPPIQGNLPDPTYSLHPPVGSFFSGSLEERDLDVPKLHCNQPHHPMNQQQPIMCQDGRQGLDPLKAAGRQFEHDAPFPLREVFDGCRNPNLLLEHGSSFVSQPTPHIEDNFMQTDLEKGGPADKDVFVQWLSGFLSQRRKNPAAKPVPVAARSIAEARGLIYGSLKLISQLDSLYQLLESRQKAGEPWTQDYAKAADIWVDLEKTLKMLERPGYIQGVKRKLGRVRKKRQRKRQAAEEEEKAEAERSAQREATIDLWRMRRVQDVEERKRERELKAAADDVLAEVRKKQNDVKKMLDVLKSLEKLRKLRKEAAGRKGVCPPPSADETFTNRIKRLRIMAHKRSTLYDAEEKTLRVILEGEQEEERQRDNDKRLKKEKEKLMQKQRELDSLLFGDTEPLPSLHPLQPFRQYYLQAEHSVVSLVQIRHEWDKFLVPPDHPNGSSIPRGWVLPAPPSNDIWARALHQLD